MFKKHKDKRGEDRSDVSLTAEGGVEHQTEGEGDQAKTGFVYLDRMVTGVDGWAVVELDTSSDTSGSKCMKEDRGRGVVTDINNIIYTIY